MTDSSHCTQTRGSDNTFSHVQVLATSHQVYPKTTECAELTTLSTCSRFPSHDTMSPKSSLQDLESPHSNKNDIRPLATSLHGTEGFTLDEAVFTDVATNVSTAATLDAEVTAGKASSVEPGIHRMPPQQTQLTSTQIESGETPAIEDPIPTSFSSHSSG